MRDDLLYYYERELGFLRRTGAEFAQRYPKVASRLLLEPNKCDDPHVERLLEGFAFLAARVHLRIDEDFPEFSEALLNVAYPLYTRPIPSLSLVQFELDPEQGKLTTGLRIPRETPLYSRPVGGVPCRFRTCYDTTLWPVSVEAARWLPPHALHPPIRGGEASAALRVELACFADVTFAQLEMDTLRLHLNAEANLASTLYEVLCNNTVEILIRDPDDPAKAPVTLPPAALRPVGFARDEGLLPLSPRSFPGYRLLQEYFAFPDKFFFLDLAGWDRVRAAGFGPRAEVVFLIRSFERPERRAMLEAGVGAQVVRLGCTPIVNLFPQTSEPVLLTQRQHEYVLVPDARRRAWTGIFSVEEVVGVTPGSAEPLRYEPLYSFRHGAQSGRERLFWYARRRPAGWRTDEGTDVVISFVDASARASRPEADAVTARLLCFNGDLPARLPFGTTEGDFEMPGGGAVGRIVTLVKPTAAVQPPLGKPQLWRLISQLALNYASLLEGDGETLRELLRLHDFGNSASGEQQIQGILGVRGEPHYARLESEHGMTFARGNRVHVEFDEEHFAGGGVYLLASVLERVLGLSVSMNSFCVLAARTRQRKEVLREWEPRSGWKALV